MRVTDRDPNHLHPAARALMERHQAAILRRLGAPTTCIETHREDGRQEDAFAAGLTEKRAGGSHHNVKFLDGRPASCAWHLVIDPAGALIIGFGSSVLHPRGCLTAPVDMGRHGVKALSSEELLYLSIGVIGEELGATWGGRWDVRGKGPDWTHFQLAFPLSHIKSAMRLQGGDLSALARSA